MHCTVFNDSAPVTPLSRFELKTAQSHQRRADALRDRLKSCRMGCSLAENYTVARALCTHTGTVSIRSTGAVIGFGANHFVLEAEDQLALRIRRRPECAAPPRVDLLLQGVDGWPRMVAYGCCRASDGRRYEVIARERHLRPFSRTVASTPLCVRRGYAEHRCAAHVLAKSAWNMHVLTERLRVMLLEHFTEDKAKVGDQFCESAFDGGLIVCDTDHVEWNTDDPPRNPSTVFANDGTHVVVGTGPSADVYLGGGRVAWQASELERFADKHVPVIDQVYLISRALVPRFFSVEPRLRPLMHELERRHWLLRARCVGARQLSFLDLGRRVRNAFRL